MFRIVFLIVITSFVFACQQNQVIKTHGIAYLDKREKLLEINKSNKNDTIQILGQPSTKGLSNDNLWIYIERTITRGKLLKLGRNYVKKSNTLILEFDKYGILKSKQFRDINNMKKISFSKAITQNEIKKENFIESFLSSVRQKMQSKRK